MSATNLAAAPGTDTTSQPAIEQLLRLFEAGDPALMGFIAADIDFRIDHYRDSDGVDVSWQQATDIEGFGVILSRLGPEVFPQGTKIVGLSSQDLGDGWYNTRFHQRYHYAVRGRMVESVTFILSHQADGKIDYFRETVTTVNDI
ncbi:hypothetical protein BWR17_05910 [Phaeobacter inhibens]|uniref:hypothetical protein n=1 Tax=Phaeobacter inhibens TaxID=221822 RepID=UPI00097198E0|nr:hypothetical protein [Phaeobacter inhibens]APX15414.1 hypothetical protein BWR17_05910 [Phaeobacter inhibens]